MTIFAMLRPDLAPNNADLHSLISEKFAGNFCRISTGQWLLSYDKTVHDLSDEFGMVKGSPFAGTLVISVSSYSGLQSPQLWEWIRRRWRSKW